jgi:hypothetical protein
MSGFTVTLADGQDVPYTDNDASRRPSFRIEANGVLVITIHNRDGAVIETQRYSPTGWRCVHELHEVSPQLGFDAFDPDES